MRLFLSAFVAGLVLMFVGRFSYPQAVGILFATAIVVLGFQKGSHK